MSNLSAKKMFIDKNQYLKCKLLLLEIKIKDMGFIGWYLFEGYFENCLYQNQCGFYGTIKIKGSQYIL